MLVLSSLHNSVDVPKFDNQKKKPNTILDYNKTKGAVDTYDQMLRLYSTKAASRRWPMHVFYNMIDMALINSHVLYKTITKSKYSRKQFIQKLSEQLTGETKNATKQSFSEPSKKDVKKLTSRQTCKISKCRNRTLHKCFECQIPVCGVCSSKICPQCLEVDKSV